MIAAWQDALEDEGTAHRVEKSKMVWDAPAEMLILKWRLKKLKWWEMQMKLFKKTI